MIKNFNNLKESGIRYGGHAGNKLGVVIDGENWFLKFPKSTKDLLRKVDISYNTSPLSEYIGSHIYKSLGIPVHETMLGIKDEKLVVACKDFRKNQIDYRLDDYNSIKNDYVEGLEKKLESTSSSNPHAINIDETIIIMNNNPLFNRVAGLKDRFWDMFIVDSLIGNPDRNNENWGLIRSTENSFRIAPVFDCGNCFNGKLSERQMREFLSGNMQEISLMRPCIYERAPGKRINAHQYISSHINKDCDKAVNRIVPRIDLNEISGIINDTPGIGDVEKEFYERLIQIRYEENLFPALQYLRKRELEFDMEER